MTYHLRSSTRALLAIVTAFALVATFVAQFAYADVDPGGCTDNGGGISVAAFRADGVTNIGVGTVTDGESINYKATLSALPPPNCAFEGGTWSLTTPDGVVHNLGAVPRIGGTGVPSITSALVPYVVNHANEQVNSTRHIDAVTNYGGGISHADTGDETNGPQLQSSKILKVVHTPTVTTNVHDANHTVITHAAIGASVHDNAVVAGESGGPVPTGTVNFARYNNTTCTGDAVNTQSGVALAAGTAESSATTLPAGGMSYKVHYNGDGNYVAADAACEPLTADKLTPTVTTDIHDAAHAVVTSVQAGSTVHDRAAVTGSGGTPTGTVDFTWYTNGTCSSEGVAAGTGVALVAGVAHPSSNEGPLSTGSYSFKAHYNGDATYSAADAQCEPLTVTMNHPTIATTLSATSVNTGASVHDSSTLTGATATAGGTVTYTVYTDNACTQGAMSAGTKNVTNGIVPDSNALVFNTAGTFYWQASYSGDAANAAAVSPCQSEILVVTQPAGQYCSPGYWKQSHHFDSYVGYSPNQTFQSVFGVNAFPGKTLVQVLSSGGGGLTAYGRATIGALLNASALSSGLTPAQVISKFNATYAGAPSGNSNGYYGSANPEFTAPENCPLN